MKNRSFLVLAGLAPLLLIACGGLSDNAELIAENCEATGGSNANCACIAAGLDESLSEEELEFIVRLWNPDEADVMGALFGFSGDLDKMQSLRRIETISNQVEASCSR